jgi:hypothetical protein
MQLLQSILQIARLRAPVKSANASADLPVAVRPITGLPLAPVVLVRRFALAAWLGARRAVRANIPERTYLRTQLALYRATAPREVTAPVPEIEISLIGEFVVRYIGDERHPNDTIFEDTDLSILNGPVAAEAAYQRNATQAANVVVARKLEEKEADLRTTERQVREREDELEQVQAAKAQAVAAQTDALEDGTADVAPVVSAPPLAKIAFFRIFEVATIAGEAMNAFAALANTAGLDPANMTTEWANGAALGILGWSVAAVTIATLMFVMAETAFARIAAAVGEPSDPTRAFRVTMAVAVLVFDACVVAAIAYLRAQLGTGGHMSVAAWCVYVLLGAAPLIGGALVHLHANGLAAERTQALRITGTPSAIDLAQRLRTEREKALIVERDRLRVRRDKLVNDIQLLNAQMHGAEQAVRDIARWETSVVERWVDSMRAALAKDQKYFDHFARAWNRMHLLAESAAPAPQAATVVPMRKRRAQ